MRTLLALLFVIISFGIIKAQYQGPISPIDSGYGSDGPYAVSLISIINDHWLLNTINVFYPVGTSSPIPTIFYSHGYGGNDTTYQIELLRHNASKGYAVVFVPYKTLGVTIAERYATLYDGFVKAARNLTSIIDTSRVGFVGHSFGGGATPRMAYRAFTENDWGKNQRFIFCSAPWYTYDMDEALITNFPTDCKMITLLYADDVVNDHRMGMDIFNHVSIDDSIKDCITVYSDTISDYIYKADHYLPRQYSPYSVFDALDYYAVFRLLDALADYTFTGNLSAKDIALGNGSEAQITMGDQLKTLTVSDDPFPTYPMLKYDWPCDTVINERRQYCQNTTSLQNYQSYSTIKIFPNPTKDLMHIDCGNQKIKSILLYSSQGILISHILPNEFSMANFPDGIYYLNIVTDTIVVTKKIIKLYNSIQ